MLFKNSDVICFKGVLKTFSNKLEAAIVDFNQAILLMELTIKDSKKPHKEYIETYTLKSLKYNLAILCILVLLFLLTKDKILPQGTRNPFQTKE